MYLSDDGNEYDVVLTKNETRFLRKLVRKAAMTMPPDEFSDWISEEIPSDRVMEFYYSFVYPDNKA